MPTANPRLTVTLTPAVAAVLRELCELTGESQSATVAGLLETSVPVFERVVTALRAAQAIREESTAEIVGSLQTAQTRIEQQLGLMLDDVDAGFRPLLETAEGIRRRRSGGGRGAVSARRPAPEAHQNSAPTPVPLTGGSGPQRRHRKAPSKGTTGGSDGGV